MDLGRRVGVMAKSPAVSKTLNDAVAVVVAALDSGQAAVKSRRGKFGQVLFTHAEPPGEGSKGTPDAIDAKPPHDADALPELKGELAEVDAFRLAIDEYVGPRGDGYVVRVESMVDGKRFARSIVHGADTHLGKDWHEVVAPAA